MFRQIGKNWLVGNTSSNYRRQKLAHIDYTLLRVRETQDTREGQKSRMVCRRELRPTIAGDCVHIFFDVYLKDASTGRLNAVPSRSSRNSRRLKEGTPKNENVAADLTSSHSDDVADNTFRGVDPAAKRCDDRSESAHPSKTTSSFCGAFSTQGRHGWTLRLRDSINLSVHLSEAAVNPYPTPVSTLRPRNLVPE